MGRIVAISSLVGGYDAPPNDGLTVAVSDDDGQTWRYGLLPDAQEWRDAAWNGVVWCAVAGNTSFAATSRDGLSWTRRTIPTPSNGDTLWHVIAWNGQTFCAITESSSSLGVAASPDGDAWTLGSIPVHGGMGLAAKQGLFCTLDNPPDTLTSTDGLAWVRHANVFPGVYGWNGMASNGVSFLATGLPVSGGQPAPLGVSTDGVVWTYRDAPVAGSWSKAAWNGTVWCAVVPTVGAFTSSDGLNWTQHSMPAGETGWSFRSLTWNGAVFCAITTAGTVYTSPTGETWTNRGTLSPAGAYWGVVTSDYRTPGVSYPATLPATLNATNDNANTTAATNANGTSLDFTASQIAEWTVDAGAGGTFILDFAFDAAASTSASLTVDGGAPDSIALSVGAPMTAAHRTSGVAPLAVFFDAVDVTPAAAGTQEYYASPYPWTSGVTQPTDMEGSLWSWDFGDSGAGTWATTGNAKNTATGYTAAHVYETPGTYTARLTVTDTAGTVRTYAQTITVSDPDAAFATTTKYVAANGSDSAAGTQVAPYLTLGRAMTDIANGVAKRVLLRRGDTFNVGTSVWSVTADGPGLIGAYGSGARPVITCSNTSFTNIITFTNSGSTWPTMSGADWRVMDLDFNMTNGAASQASSVGPHNGGRTTANLLMLRVLARNFAVAFLWQTWDQWAYEHSNTGIFLVDCEGGPNVGNGSYGCYGGGYHSAWLGNNLHDNQNSGGTHVLRVWQAHKCAISNNRLWRPGNNRHCLKLHSPSYRGDSSGPGNSQPGTDPANWVPGIRSHEPCTRWVNVTDNIVSGTSPAVTSMPASYVVSIGPQDSINEEWTSHIVYERNRHTGAGWVYTEVESSASHILVRNNLFDATASTFTEYRGVLFMRRGIEPSPTDMRILNNTWYQGATRNECYVAEFDAVAGPVTTMRNNLFVYPGGSGFTAGAPWFNQPPATSDHNLWSTAAAATIFTDAANGDFTLRAGSPAVDVGVVIPEAREDFVRVVRAGRGTSFDLGAYER